MDSDTTWSADSFCSGDVMIELSTIAKHTKRRRAAAAAAAATKTAVMNDQQDNDIMPDQQDDATNDHEQPAAASSSHERSAEAMHGQYDDVASGVEAGTTYDCYDDDDDDVFSDRGLPKYVYITPCPEYRSTTVPQVTMTTSYLDDDAQRRRRLHKTEVVPRRRVKSVGAFDFVFHDQQQHPVVYIAQQQQQQEQQMYDDGQDDNLIPDDDEFWASLERRREEQYAGLPPELTRMFDRFDCMTGCKWRLGLPPPPMSWVEWGGPTSR